MKEINKPITVTEAIKKVKENTAVKSEGNTVAPDWQDLYTKECAKSKALENKIEQLEGLVKSYAQNTEAAQLQLKRATLEYNARVDYLLDCAKHAFLSMQFAVNATSNMTQGGKKND